MHFNIINRLRSASPINRPAILEETYHNNLSFFKTKYPQLFQFIERTICPYHIDITDSFLNLVDKRSGQLAHPEAGLDSFAEMLGGWTHETWVDLFNFNIPTLNGYPKHADLVECFSNRVHQNFPAFFERLNGGRINLKEIENIKKFSPPVVFLGIFHGLHIAHYLKNTDLTTALFIEPEPERFEVSCYFLDYAEIERRFGTLYLAIGDDTTAASIESFFSLLRITPMMWTRILCGYPFDKAHFFIESIKSLQATSTNLLYPLDNELDSLIHGAINLNQKLPLLTTRPSVSRQCEIVVVATGPSLERDLEWLKDNQKNLIIFSVHSAVKILRNHGIKPDFQFNLDTVINYNFKETLELFPEVPFVTDYKVPPHIVADFEHPLLCADRHKNSPVNFFTSLTETHPSTTNLAFSFACFIKPATIYLLGCDCGYRELKQDHVKGSFYEESRDQGKPLSYAETALQSLVEPNFSDTDPIQTISQHLRTKIIIERCISNNANGITILNLSDGAKIAGAIPQRSADTTICKYKKKRRDIEEILNSFSPSKEKINWKIYSQSGTEKLRQMKGTLVETLTIKSFSWNSISQALDNALNNALKNNWDFEQDHRIDCFCRVIGDIFCIWYRCLILFDDINEARKIYITGLLYFQETLKEIHWPNVLDHIQYDGMEEKLSHEWKIYLAKIYYKQGKFYRTTKLINMAYDDNPDIKDSFIRLSWILAEKRRWQKAFEIAVQDEKRKRLSPIWQVHLAQLYGRRNEFSHAAKLIEVAYKEDADLRDGFARLGWIRMETRHWDSAHDLMQKDYEQGRISPSWKMYLAVVKACLQRWPEAMALVAEAYMEDTSLSRDGYSRLGWWGYLLGKEKKFFHDNIHKDNNDEYFSGYRPLFEALYLTVINEPNNALHIVNQAYQNNPRLENWLTFIGWLQIRLGNYDHGLELINNDYKQGRMGNDWLASYAIALGICGKNKRATKLLQNNSLFEKDDSIYPIGFTVFPEAWMNMTEIQRFINSTMSYNDLKNYSNQSRV